MLTFSNWSWQSSWRDRSGNPRNCILRRWWCIFWRPTLFLSSNHRQTFSRWCVKVTDSLWSVMQLFQTQRHGPLPRASRVGPSQCCSSRSVFCATQVTQGFLTGRQDFTTTTIPWPVGFDTWSNYPEVRVFFSDVFFRKCSADRWDSGELSCGDKGLSCPLEFGVPACLFVPACYRLFSELVQGEPRAWGMCWSLMPAPVSWSTAISLPPRRMGLTTSGAPAGWYWAGVFFSRFFIWKCRRTLRFCTCTVEIQVM